jgi:hypothetical protein
VLAGKKFFQGEKNAAAIFHESQQGKSYRRRPKISSFPKIARKSERLGGSASMISATSFTNSGEFILFSPQS